MHLAPRFSSAKRLKSRAVQTANADVWKLDVPTTTRLGEKGWLPHYAVWMEKEGEYDVDVVRFEHLMDRALCKDKPWIEILRDLLVLDRKNNLRVLILKELMTAR